MKILLSLAVATLASSVEAFVPSFLQSARTRAFSLNVGADIATKKPTGTSFLPNETVGRAKVGNPTEKAKIEKDPVNAWVDVYEYARKIREGEMTWEDVEKADLDTVGAIILLLCHNISSRPQRKRHNLRVFSPDFV